MIAVAVAAVMKVRVRGGGALWVVAAMRGEFKIRKQIYERRNMRTVSEEDSPVPGKLPISFMCTHSALNTSRALEGVHGVHLVPHSPFPLEDISQHKDFPQSPCESSALKVQRVWQQKPSCLRPIQCCLDGDKHIAETIANVLTSIPFIVLGNLNCKLYANSLIGVGVASSLYHASRGKLRKYLRWADYTTIATATVCLSRALRNENPKLLMAASALFLPIQPLMVSAVHTGMMEVAFAKRAVQDPELKRVHKVHKISSLLGGAFFVADDAFPQTPYLHAAWHLAAAIGVSTCNKLLE
ncbi:hypothetical protein LguiA_000667 [Lonicera macranthoides]